MSTCSTAVARVIHHVDLTGRVIGIEVEPAGPAPTQQIAAAAFRAGLRTAPYLAGGDTEQYRLVRQIFLKQVTALTSSAAQVIDVIATAQPRRTDVRGFVGGFHAAIDHLQHSDALQLMRERVADVRPYLQAVAQQQLFPSINFDATTPVPAMKGAQRP